MTSENSTHDNTASPQANAYAGDKPSSPETPILPAGTAMAEIPPSHSNYKISREERRDGWDYAKLVAEFVGLGFLIAYTLFTASIYSAHQKAAYTAQKTLSEINTPTTLLSHQ